MRVRAGLVAVIYQKALVLSNDESGKATGDIVNLMSVDASRLQDLCTYGLMIVSAPLQVMDKMFLNIGNSDNATFHKGHARIHLAIQPSRMGRIRWGCHHDLFRPVEYSDRKFLEEPPDQADEVQGQAFALDERIVGEYQEVLQYPIGLAMTASHNTNPMI
jgi:hypothetical protein